MKDDPMEPKEDDNNYVQSVLHELNVKPEDYDLFTRLGMRQHEGSKPRPLRFKVPSIGQKINILKRARNLKESKFHDSFISQDCTPKKREDKKNLEREFKKRTNKGEYNIVIRRGRIVN